MYGKLDTGSKDFGTVGNVGFLGRGVTVACFSSVGIFEDCIERLIIFVIIGASLDVHSLRIDVGKGSRSHVFGADLFINLLYGHRFEFA